MPFQMCFTMTWKEQKIEVQNLETYHDLHMKMDVYQLADYVFENFTKTHLYKVPGLARKAALEMTVWQLE